MVYKVSLDWIPKKTTKKKRESNDLKMLEKQRFLREERKVWKEGKPIGAAKEGEELFQKWTPPQASQINDELKNLEVSDLYNERYIAVLTLYWYRNRKLLVKYITYDINLSQ